MQLFQQSEATAAQRRLFFHAVDATDGITAETGLTGTGRISKNGAATAATAASISEVDSTNMPGRYYIELTAAEIDTLGIIEFRYKAAACAEVIARAQVVPFDPYDSVRMGLTALPNAAADAAGGLPISDAGGLDLDTKLANTNQITAARMAELDAANLPADIDAILADTADMQPKLGLPAGASMSADIAAVAGYIDTDVAAILVDTGTTLDGKINDIQARLPAALLGGRMDANVGAISASATAADNLKAGALALVTGTAAGVSTTTVIDTDLTEATNDHYVGRIVTFTTGAIAGQSTDVTSYDGTTKELTVTALTDPPSAGDMFVIS